MYAILNGNPERKRQKLRRGHLYGSDDEEVTVRETRCVMCGRGMKQSGTANN